MRQTTTVMGTVIAVTMHSGDYGCFLFNWSGVYTYIGAQFIVAQGIQHEEANNALDVIYH
jgi:hypothetical protein